jgi:hypothetical protein
VRTVIVVKGYDAVITLSNDLAPVGGMHPVVVDGRKLRKVALHHISWSEVLHEAQMQLAHRGVEDRLQADRHEGKRPGGREALPSERKHVRSHRAPTRSREAEWRR